jgi:hypothetical protein
MPPILMTPEPEIISWSVLFPTTWTPRNWPPQTLTDLTDIWVVITIGVALGMLFWAMIRTAQVWLKTRAYLSLASHLASDAGAFEPEADRVILTPRGRDHGVDVVVIGHRANANMLIQVKTTTTGALDSEEAVRQLEGGRRFYENALGLKFTKMRVHTNVNKFSSRTLQAAKIYKTEALGFDWIESVLKKTPITRVDIITRNAQ